MKERVLPSEIELERTWRLGPQLGEGGFARVFLAQDESENPAVVKLVPKEPGTDREMLFVELDGVPNVMPLLDSGESDDYWVLVMPRAEKSLRDYLNETSGLTTNGGHIGACRHCRGTGCGGGPGRGAPGHQA